MGCSLSWIQVGLLEYQVGIIQQVLILTHHQGEEVQTAIKMDILLH